MNKKVIVRISDDFDMDKIADSGQCFRWEKQDENTYRILAGKRCVYLTHLESDRYEIGCPEEEFTGFWSDYFDLCENYGSIRSRISRGADPFLWNAADSEKGIRILRQDPWEMLITFIISQNRNIPAIHRSVELLAERCGDARIDGRGKTYFAFPDPEAVASLSDDDLNACRLGYRCGYVHAAAEAVLNGDIVLEELYDADEDTTIKTLTGLYGVGPKVANCISLFGLHHVDAFPVDVWMKRILAEEYADGYPYEEYSPYNGIYQQYMFAYYRHRDNR